MNRISEDPCFKEHEASLKCLDKNNYDGEKCEQQFLAYRACRKRTAAEQLAERRSKSVERQLYNSWFGKNKPEEGA